MQSFLTGGDLVAALASSRSPNGSLFLNDLRDQWNILSVNNKWFAAAGRACEAIFRIVNGQGGPNGCLDPNNSDSDGAICDQSARLVYPGKTPINAILVPSKRWEDSNRQYQHAANIGVPNTTIGILMCPNNSSKDAIINPQPVGVTGLFAMIQEFLNGL